MGIPHDRSRAAGADVYLTKPVRRVELHNALLRLTGRMAPGLVTVDTQAADAMDSGGARVLLAEDNPVNQEIARAMLESAGCEVTLASHSAATSC